MKWVKQSGDWEKQATRAFLVLTEGPRVAIPSILGANGGLNPKAGFTRGNLELTVLIEKPGMCLIF